jgi:hypothetical protein
MSHHLSLLKNNSKILYTYISDDTTYVTRARDPIATAAHEARCNPRQSLYRVRVSGDCNRVRNLPCL